MTEEAKGGPIKDRYDNNLAYKAHESYVPRNMYGQFDVHNMG